MGDKPAKAAEPIRRAMRAGVVFLLFFMPYSTFVLQVVRHLAEEHGHPFGSLLVRATVGWKEIVLALLAAGFLALWASERRFPIPLSRFDRLLLWLAAVGTVWGGLSVHRISPVVFGFRYDFSPFFYYLAARAAFVRRDHLFSLVRWLVLAAVPLSIFALLQTFVLPLHFMERFGYAWGTSVTGNPLPPYHLIGDHWIRALATFPGPNSLAMYSVTLLAALLFLGRKLFPSWLRYGLTALFAAALLVTFSRGHLLAAAMSLVALAAFFFLRRTSLSWKGKSLGMAGVVVILLLGGFFGTLWLGTVGQGQKKPGWYELILHDESSAIHRDVRLQAWESIRQHPFGTGLGTSGLATTNTGGTVFNPESWYVQVVQEFGWIAIPGLLLFLYGAAAFFWLLDGSLYDPDDRSFLCFFLAAFLAAVFSADFLPSWFEVGSLTFWLLFGLFAADYFRSFPLAADESIQASE